MADYEVRHEIVEKLGVLHQTSGGWTLELNRVSWNNGKPKFDIRCWKHDEGACGKGVTFDVYAAHALVRILSEYLDKTEKKGE